MKPRGAPSAFGLPPGRVGHSDTVGGAPAMSSAKSAQFGSHAAEVKVTPRAGKSRSGVETIQKPYTGMTIRLTPELLARLQQPGPRPEIELLLRSAGEGGPVLIVAGVQYNTNAHKMAVGSEVHVVARTEPAGRGSTGAAGGGEGRAEKARERGGGEGSSMEPGVSIFASLHRKLIVQQVLTETKRAEIRARNDEIDRVEKDAKKTMVRMEDQDEMLAAAESIPVPARQMPLAGSGTGQEFQDPGGMGAGVGGVKRGDRKRPRSPSAMGGGQGEGEGEGNGWGFRERDPLTAWVYGCYNHDDYTGHVSDLRHFLRGIDFHHAMMRYHVKEDGTLDPDRRRFCIKFKTKGGRDLAVGRSGEALGSSESWSPDSVPVVRGRNEGGDGGGGGEGRLGPSPNDFMVVLRQGCSVAEVLGKIKERLPQDLTPAVGTEHTDSSSDRDGRGRPHHHHPLSHPHPPPHHRQLENYRRDMLRASLGATLGEARHLGAERGAPRARVAGTDEDNARRVATLAANEAARELDVGVEAARGGGVGGVGGGGGGEAGRKLSRRRGRRRKEAFSLPSGPKGGARDQQRRRRRRGIAAAAV